MKRGLSKGVWKSPAALKVVRKSPVSRRPVKRGPLGCWEGVWIWRPKSRAGASVITGPPAGRYVIFFFSMIGSVFLHPTGYYSSPRKLI